MDIPNIDNLLQQKFPNRNYTTADCHIFIANNNPVNFEVVDIEDRKIVYRYAHSGKSGIHIIESIDEIAKLMVEDFTGIKLHVGTVNIQTDEICEVLIDRVQIGNSPISKNIPPSAFNVKVLLPTPS